MQHEPATLDCELQAGAIFGVLRSRYRNGALIFSMWIRRSCTGSIVLAISTNLRAAFSVVFLFRRDGC